MKMGLNLGFPPSGREDGHGAVSELGSRRLRAAVVGGGNVWHVKDGE
jgi:hypothetical protein